MIQVLNLSEPKTRTVWSEFVSNHPTGNVFQTPEMCEIVSGSTKQEPIALGYFNHSSELLGLLSGVIIKEHSGLLGRLSARAIVFGGPLVLDNDEAISSKLIKSFDKICKKKVVYSQFRNIWDVKDLKEVFVKAGYVFTDHLDLITALDQTEEKLWNKIQPNGRNKINKAIREGTKVKTIDGYEYISKIYLILQEVYNNAKLPLPEYVYFKRAIEILEPRGFLKCFGAFHHEDLIGVRLELVYKDTIYDWYAGSYIEYRKYNPNDILPWEIIKWGKSNGYKFFDFGGAGKPGVPYGVRDYKIKFGGNQVCFGRYQKIYNPIQMKISQIGFHIWKYLK